MFPKFQFHRLGLCQEASEESPAPSGAGPAESAPAVEAATTAPQTPEVKVGVVETVKAIVSGAEGNARTIAGLNLQIQQLTTERDTALQQIAGLQTQVANLTADNTRLSAEARSVEDAIAGIGIPQAQLPAQAPAGAAPAMTAAELSAAAEAEPDPAKKGKLARQSMELLRLESKAASGGKN